MLPVLQVGPAAIQMEGLILLLGLWIGLTLSEKFCNEEGNYLDRSFITWFSS